jgi:hypothetical protein
MGAFESSPQIAQNRIEIDQTDYGNSAPGGECSTYWNPEAPGQPVLDLRVHLRAGSSMTGNLEPHRLTVSPCERGEDPADGGGFGRVSSVFSPYVDVVSRGSAG